MKNIVITGAGKGIGRAMAHAFAAGGDNVFICARTEGDLKETAATYPDRVKYSTCDMSNKEDVKKFAAVVKNHFAQIDVLINNAGIYMPGSIAGEEDKVFEMQMNTNLGAAYYLTKELLPYFIKQKGGHIFNTCSVASIVGYPNGASYCISKFALYGMTKVLREEMKPYNVKVTAILPGATLTSSWDGEEVDKNNFILPEDVAKMVYSAAQLSYAATVEEILIRPLKGDV